MKIRKFQGLIVISLALCLQGCFALRPASTRSGKHLYETYYLGENRIQYFIKPLEFMNAEDEELFMDITFRYSQGKQDTATMNLSLITDRMTRKLDSIKISAANYSFTVSPWKHMFSETEKKRFEYRATSLCPVTVLRTLFSSNAWEITAFGDLSDPVFLPAGKTAASINRICQGVFIVVE